MKMDRLNWWLGHSGKEVYERIRHSVFVSFSFFSLLFFGGRERETGSSVVRQMSPEQRGDGV